MPLPDSYPTPRVPMYILTIVEPTGKIVKSEYISRYDTIRLVPLLDLTLEVDEYDNFKTQSHVLASENILILTCIYLQISTGNYA